MEISARDLATIKDCVSPTSEFTQKQKVVPSVDPKMIVN